TLPLPHASVITSAERARMQASGSGAVSQPTCWEKKTPPSSLVAKDWKLTGDMICQYPAEDGAALTKSPRAIGEAINAYGAPAADEKPVSVTFPGSPPKIVMLSWTHWSARIWSQSP